MTWHHQIYRDPGGIQSCLIAKSLGYTFVRNRARMSQSQQYCKFAMTRILPIHQYVLSLASPTIVLAAKRHPRARAISHVDGHGSIEFKSTTQSL